VDKKTIKFLMAVFALATSFSYGAVPNPSDPTLKLWLQPDNYVQTGGMWTNSSSTLNVDGTPIKLGRLMSGEANTDPANHQGVGPVSITNGSKTFNTVQFRRANDPVSPPTPGDHKADWLYQQYTSTINKTSPNPLMDGDDLTVFVAVNNQAMTGWLGGWQTIAGIRGPSGSPYSLGLYTTGEAVHAGVITYAGSVVYYSDLTIANHPELSNTSGWGILEFKYSNTAAGISTLTIGQNFGDGWQYSTPQVISRNAGAGPDVVSGAINAPFALGGHAQGAGAYTAAPYGNGQSEAWAGWMGDVLVYSRALIGTEETGIQDYLAYKYGIVTLQPPASISYPTSSSTGQYTVSWSSTGDATSYQLERSSDGGSSWSQVYSDVNTSYSETIGSGSYRYRVKATNSDDSSSWSAGAWNCVVGNLPPITGCVVTLTTDLNSDCVVDFKDLAVLGQQWVGIDYNNVDVVSEQWLKCTKINDLNCQMYIEPAIADKWIKQAFTGSNPTPPISFKYNGVSSSTFLPTWNFSRTKTDLDPNRTQWTLVYTEPGNGPLKVTCQIIEYHDYPAVEWTVYFKNIGTNNTPILNGIQGLNVFFQRSSESEFILNGIKGDWTVAESYEPYRITLGMNAVKNFTPSNHVGKSTSGPDGWPYFNLQMPGSGVLLAVGWPGQWASTFARDASNGLRITAGQQLTNLLLKPGEQIRTPLIAMLFWAGTDVVRAQNLWRRWYIAYNMPRVNGQPQQPITQIQGDNMNVVNSYLQAGINPDILWRDAGGGSDSTWYPSSDGPFTGGLAWLNTGTWEIDPAKYPNGFKPLTDQLHALGMKFLLWFEPERVGDPNSWLGKNHPEWLLWYIDENPLESPWLNEGDPAALSWLIDHFDGMIKSQGIDWYREDINGWGPLMGWRKNDAADRQGMTENLYVQGHLAFWDELRRRNPSLRIDSCASGGRRNDLETMRRAVPLTRSDFQFPDMKGVVEGNQSHTYGLSFWLPFYGNGCYFYDKYSYRSFYMPLFGMGGLSPENTEAQKQAYSECRMIAPYMLGDYYPLTPYSLQLDQWIAWQFHRSELGVGVVQAFRRSSSTVATMTFKLQGLDSAATYTVTNFDGGTSTKTGSELMNAGLAVNISTTPGSAIITYTKD
jgi:alpha-galactosidase